MTASRRTLALRQRVTRHAGRLALLFGLSTVPPVAHAEEDWSVRIQAITEQVEAVVQRRFVVPPTVSIGTVAEVERQIQAGSPPPGEAGRTWMEDQRKAIAKLQEPGTLGFYDPTRAVLHVMTDRVAELDRTFRWGPTVANAVLNCVLAHELVHAIQHQMAAAPPALSEPGALGYQALTEGMAVVATRGACTISPPLRVLAETYLPMHRGEEAGPWLEYGAGSAFVEAVWSRQGTDAVWALFDAPPDEATLREAHRGSPRAGWLDTDWVAAPLEPLGVKATRLPPMEWLAKAVMPPARQHPLPPIVEAAAVGAIDETEQMRGYTAAYAFVDERKAKAFEIAWEDGWRTAAPRYESLGSLPQVRGALVVDRASGRETGDPWVRVRIGSKRSPDAVLVLRRRGAQVAIVAATSSVAAGALLAAATLLDHWPAGTRFTPDRSEDVTDAPLGAYWLTTGARRAFTRGGAKDCLAALGEHGATPARALPSVVKELAWYCSIMDGDFQGAEAWRRVVATPYTDSSLKTAWQHVSELWRAGQRRAARGLLEDVVATERANAGHGDPARLRNATAVFSALHGAPYPQSVAAGTQATTPAWRLGTVLAYLVTGDAWQAREALADCTWGDDAARHQCRQIAASLSPR